MLNVDKLSALLAEAKQAHSDHAKANPGTDHANWPNWYAQWLAGRLEQEAQERPKTEGHHENERNARYRELYTDMIKEAHGVDQVIIGHHLVYVDIIKGTDGFDYHIPSEIPSADALIFDHFEAEKIWGPEFKAILMRLVVEPVATRDELLKELYYSRKK